MTSIPIEGTFVIDFHSHVNDLMISESICNAPKKKNGRVPRRTNTNLVFEESSMCVCESSSNSYSVAMYSNPFLCDSRIIRRLDFI